VVDVCLATETRARKERKRENKQNEEPPSQHSAKPLNPDG
jgi:hypothetical protein